MDRLDCVSLYINGWRDVIVLSHGRRLVHLRSLTGFHRGPHGSAKKSGPVKSRQGDVGSQGGVLGTNRS